MADDDLTPCEKAGVHLPGTGHSQTDCPTVMRDDVDRLDNVVEGPWGKRRQIPVTRTFPDGCPEAYDEHGAKVHNPSANPACALGPARAERLADGPRTMIGGSMPRNDLDAPAVFKGSGMVHTSAGVLDVEVMVSAWSTHAEVAYRSPGQTSWSAPTRCDRVD